MTLPAPDAPLRTRKDGGPLLHAALAIELYLESPAPDQAGAYAEAVALVRDWIGGTLRWTHMSTLGEPAPFDGDDLDHVEQHVAGAAPPELDDDVTNMAARVHRIAHGDFALVCHGGDVDWDSSPTTFRFHVEPIEPPPSTRSAAMLRVSVPATTALADVRARALALASLLPVRWGIVGLATLGWDVDHFQEVHAASHAVARRHPGFDLGLYALSMPTWFHSLRTVSWITLVGPALQERLGRLGAALPPAAPPPLVMSPLSSGVVAIEAPAPDPGDQNRRRFPPGYALADRLVRPVRAASKVHFSAPWTERTTEEWLRRFEAARP